ncbi:hypothetical protein [Floridanema aerugineum]|uniref:Uncharacterized protein n=1 Tax=Floridaenema aerugineum BLCC-F46 TaxID=3153654 RepID=A0ABV4XGN1_9CYAN
MIKLRSDEIAYLFLFPSRPLRPLRFQNFLNRKERKERKEEEEESIKGSIVLF